MCRRVMISWQYEFHVVRLEHVWKWIGRLTYFITELVKID